MNMIKTFDNSGVTSWSDLPHDVLLLVMMRLGVVDFLAFSGVCKSWRSFSLSNRNKFIVSRPPMSISVSVSTTDANENQYYLNEFEGRNFKISLPHFAAGSRCIGVTGGYLILFNQKTYDCWLVNLITRHELHFPNVPYDVFCCPGFFRAILVFSPSMSGWVLVVLNKCYFKLWFSIAGKQVWTKVSHRFTIYDLLAFKRKIYIIHSNYRSHEGGICEMRLYPEPKLVLLEIENFWKPQFGNPGFVGFGENLYVIDLRSKHPFRIHELDFGEMKFVSREEKGEKYAFFHNTFMDGDTITLREMWDDIHSQYGRYGVNDKEEDDGFFNAKMWYFLDECLDV